MELVANVRQPLTVVQRPDAYPAREGLVPPLTCYPQLAALWTLEDRIPTFGIFGNDNPYRTAAKWRAYSVKR